MALSPDSAHSGLLDLMADAETGGLERAVASDPWRVPAYIGLRPGFPDTIEWRSTDRDRLQGPASGMLEQFLALADAEGGDVQAVLTYARRWGVVSDCAMAGCAGLHLHPGRLEVHPPPAPAPQHREPAEAAESPETPPADTPASDEPTPPAESTARYEPVPEWLVSAAYFRHLMAISERLARGQLGSEDDWKAVERGRWRMAWPNESPESWGQTTEWVPVSEQWDTVEAQQAFLADHLNGLLHRSHVEPRVRWAGGRAVFRIAATGLASALALQLALVVTRTELLLLCDNCGQPYRPTRAPAARRHHYCHREICQQASRRDAQRRYQARKRRKEATG